VSLWSSARRRLAGALLGLVGVSIAVPTPLLTDGARASVQAKRKTKRSARQPIVVTRWLQRDVETAALRAGNGDLALAAQLYRALQRDGVIQGLLGTRTGGLVRLPKRFAGSDDPVAWLGGSGAQPGHFETHFPDSEVAKFDADAVVMGVAVAELLDTPKGPVFCRLDPEFLRYRWYEDAWIYQSKFGEERITPGDGRWVLYVSSRYEPWNSGLVWSLARAYVSKEHATFFRENWNSKLAHPARAAVAPAGATETQRRGFLERLIAWGVNTVFELPPGWDVRLIESNGRGYESFKETIQDANQEMMVSIAGQIVTITGGTGFQNGDIYASIRADLIQGDGKSLGAVLSEQAVPHVLAWAGFVDCAARVSWDTRKPTNVSEEAAALKAAADAITSLSAALQPTGLTIDVRELAARFAVPLVQSTPAPATPQLEAEPIEAPPDPANDVAPIETPAADVDAMDPADADLVDSDVARLAQQMTEHEIPQCEHGRSNRCPLCGVERVREVTRDENGMPQWRIAWRPIGQSTPAPAAEVAA